MPSSFWIFSSFSFSATCFRNRSGTSVLRPLTTMSTQNSVPGSPRLAAEHSLLHQTPVGTGASDLATFTSSSPVGQDPHPLLARGSPENAEAQHAVHSVSSQLSPFLTTEHSSPDGCRHPLPARTPVQVFFVPHYLQRRKLRDQFRFISKESGGAATTAATVRPRPRRTSRPVTARARTRGPPPRVTRRSSSDRPPAPPCRPSSSPTPTGRHLQGPGEIRQPSAGASRPAWSATARRCRSTGSTRAGVPLPPQLPGQPPARSGGPRRAPAPRTARARRGHRHQQQRPRTRPGAVPRPAPPPASALPSGAASPSAPRSLCASSTARTASSYGAARVHRRQPRRLGSRSHPRTGPPRTAPRRTPRTAPSRDCRSPRRRPAAPARRFPATTPACIHSAKDGAPATPVDNPGRSRRLPHTTVPSAVTQPSSSVRQLPATIEATRAARAIRKLSGQLSPDQPPIRIDRRRTLLHHRLPVRTGRQPHDVRLVRERPPAAACRRPSGDRGDPVQPRQHARRRTSNRPPGCSAPAAPRRPPCRPPPAGSARPRTPPSPSPSAVPRRFSSVHGTVWLRGGPALLHAADLQVVCPSFVSSSAIRTPSDETRSASMRAPSSPSTGDRADARRRRRTAAAAGASGPGRLPTDRRCRPSWAPTDGRPSSGLAGDERVARLARRDDAIRRTGTCRPATHPPRASRPAPPRPCPSGMVPVAERARHARSASIGFACCLADGLHPYEPALGVDEVRPVRAARRAVGGVLLRPGPR